uniref:Glutathione S-transeferase n=1 Tax=Dendroctonus armandi TaxID=77159 RepID=A0A0C4X6W3_9CUCU|nr:glutathione S-transeferase [Dendroctonus armandi]
MKVKLYGTIISPPTRAVLMCAKALGVDLQLINIDLVASEQISEEFMKINPCHTIPVLEDCDGFIVSDSHAINGYLVDKYGKNDLLFPKDPKVRATINHRLHFDSSVFFVKGVNIVKPLVFGGGVQPDELETKLEVLKEVFVVVERMLEQSKSLYIAGNEFSIADFSFASTITQWNIFVPYADFPKIKSYIERIQKLPFYEANKEGLSECTTLIASFLRR